MSARSVEEIQEILSHPDQIRNVSLISHIGHGKSTLVDLFASLDSDTLRKEDVNRSTTIKSTCSAVYYERSEKERAEGKKDALINLMDTPGQLDFSSEVTAALRVTDGGIVMVDIVDGVCVNTENVIRNSMSERVKICFMMNKLDRTILELQLTPEEVFEKCQMIIEDLNVVITTYQDPEAGMGSQEIQVQNGSVAFGSGLQGWAFTIPTFAKIYAKKFGVDLEKMCKHLWGNYFFDAKAKKWKNKAQDDQGKPLQRAFCQFIMTPIQQLAMAIKDGNKEKYTKMLKSLGVTLKPQEMEQETKVLLKTAFHRWLPAGQIIADMMVTHLPSPAEAQKYRTPILYEGPVDDECGKAIANCDSEGPLMLYVSKMVPTPDKARFFAFGRVFSGTVKTALPVTIQGPDHIHGTKDDMYTKKIQSVNIQFGKKWQSMDAVPAGGVVLLGGIDQFLKKTGTITTAADAHNLRLMKFSVSPVVRVAVEPKNHSDLPKLVEGLKRMVKSDPCIQTFIEESGEHVVAGAGELHLDFCLKDLVNEYMGGAPIKISPPVVSFRETVTGHSSQMCLSKSPNKHNRLFCQGQPIPEQMSLDLESGKIDPREDVKKTARILIDDHEWDATDARKIWAFGPDTKGPNCVVDKTKAVQYLNEIKDNVIAGFEWVTKEGVLCEEPMRGCRFDIHDVMLHADSIHRGGGQIISTARRVFYACQLTAAPTLQEPVYLVEIQCNQSAMSGIYAVLNRRRGVVISEEEMPGTPMTIFKAYLPVMEGFGFSGELMSKTQGKAFPTLMFDHWQTMPGNPLTPGNKVYDIVRDIRKRKGLSEDVRSLDKYHDKL